MNDELHYYNGTLVAYFIPVSCELSSRIVGDARNIFFKYHSHPKSIPNLPWMNTNTIILIAYFPVNNAQDRISNRQSKLYNSQRLSTLSA